MRLTPGEIDVLGSGGDVMNAIHFGPGIELVYLVRVGESHHLSASFDGRRIVVTMPRVLARELAETDRVGMDGVQDLGDGRALELLVEKDFACLTPRSGDADTDAYPNPRKGC